VLSVFHRANYANRKSGSYASFPCFEDHFFLLIISKWYVPINSRLAKINLDWAVSRLASETYCRSAVLLYASSYVTWTFQTHTFSNSIEAVLVSCSLVTILKFKHTRVHFIK